MSSFGKFFERIPAADITTHFINKNLFSEEQHGFRSNRSCETALQPILERWKQSVEAKQIILALFIDFKKAFDLIDPGLLFIKLFHYGFDNISLCLLGNYFKNRSQVTCINNATSERMPIHWGVPQGSMLGSLLFNNFINDLSLAVSQLKVILFVDDTSLSLAEESFLKLISRFKQYFSGVFDWINHNKLFLN